MRHRFLSAALLVFCAAPLAHATEFAILLGSRASDAATANFEAKVSSLPITGMTVTFDPSTLPLDATCIIDTNPALPDGTPSLTSAFYFSISLKDNSTGELIHQFSPPISIDFSTTTTPQISDFAMSTLLTEDGATPTWSTDNTPLTLKDGPVIHCTCSHLSTFALTPITSLPEPASASLILVFGLTLRRRR